MRIFNRLRQFYDWKLFDVITFLLIINITILIIADILIVCSESCSIFYVLKDLIIMGFIIFLSGLLWIINEIIYNRHVNKN